MENEIMNLVDRTDIVVGNVILGGLLIVAVHEDYIWATTLFNGNARIIGGQTKVKPLAWEQRADGLCEVFED